MANYKEELFLPLPLAWRRTVTYRRLQRKDRIYPHWFVILAQIAYELNDQGRICGGDGTPFEVLDIADELQIDENEAENFLKACHDLNLVSTDDDGSFRVVNYRYWLRRPSDSPEATRERKRKQREREKLAKQKTPPDSDVTTCHDGHDESRMSRHRLDKTRLDKIREDKRRQELDQTREEQTREEEIEEEKRPDPTPPPELPPTKRGQPATINEVFSSFVSFDKSKFFLVSNACHKLLTGRDMTKKAREDLEQTIKREGWRDWPDLKNQAAALFLSTQYTRHKKKNGMELRQPWPYAITSAVSFFEEGAKANREGRVPLFQPEGVVL